MTVEIVRFDRAAPASWAIGCGALLGEIFGQRDDQLELIDRWRGDAQRRVLLALDDDRVVAVCGVRLGGPDELETYAAFSPAVRAFAPGPIAELHILAVRPSHRRQGLGGRMARRLMDELIAAGATAALAVSWVHGRPYASRPMLEAGGFTPLGEIAGFYRSMHAESGQRCVYCAPAECDCVAVLFARSLTDGPRPGA